MFLDPPLARTAELQAGAVDEQVKRAADLQVRLHNQGSRPAAQGRMIGHRQVEAEQLQERADQPLCLPQTQVEDHPQCQRCLDRHGRIARLTTGRGQLDGGDLAGAGIDPEVELPP